MQKPVIEIHIGQNYTLVCPVESFDDKQMEAVIAYMKYYRERNSPVQKA